ncbi:hypothetical protein [Anaerosacchariphilus polymeriproducens]|uniref:Uncharacterized protein n=1 Tax=Anaerosacchariphilus polymeriproducens TaxID=1812858 RepID=A0A371ASP1_9FIRM|nr:hypothetical protein [Anaerosacchariphilus polymeriproducens]RDU22593.1 hypothetical protein DWV06_15060 [Anaerosacchariphilus polymeriproducens]
MGLDFYIANSIDDINQNMTSVELSEEVQEYIYKNTKYINIDLKCINELDPYGDTIIEHDKIEQLLFVFKTLVDNSFFKHCENNNEVEESIENLISLLNESLIRKEKVIAIGD